MKYTLLVVLALLLTACGGSQEAAKPTPTAKPTIAPTPTPEPHYSVGKSATRNGLEITLASAKLIDPATIPHHEQIFPYLKPGDTFLILDERVNNTTTTTQTLEGRQLVLQDANGQSFEVQIGGIPNLNTIGVGGIIAPSMKQQGNQAYIVPKSTHLFNLTYIPKEGPQAIWDIHE